MITVLTQSEGVARKELAANIAVESDISNRDLDVAVDIVSAAKK